MATVILRRSRLSSSLKTVLGTIGTTSAKKSVEHLRYLFEKNWEDSTSAVAVDGTCKWCGETHRGMCPRVRTIEYYETGTVNRVEFVTASLSKREEIQHDDSQ